MVNPKPPDGGSEGRAPAPKGIPVGGLSLDDAALILDEYMDRVALRRPVLELAAKLKKALADSSAAFNMAGATKSFPAPADHLLISIGGEGGLHSENLMTRGWSGDISPGFYDTVQNSYLFVRNLAMSQIVGEVYYYTTNEQIQACELMPQDKDITVDLGLAPPITTILWFWLLAMLTCPRSMMAQDRELLFCMLIGLVSAPLKILS